MTHRNKILVALGMVFLFAVLMNATHIPTTASTELPSRSPTDFVLSVGFLIILLASIIALGTYVIRVIWKGK